MLLSAVPGDVNPLVLEYSRSLSGSETRAGFFALNHSLSFVPVSAQSFALSVIPPPPLSVGVWLSLSELSSVFRPLSSLPEPDFAVSAQLIVSHFITRCHLSLYSGRRCLCWFLFFSVPDGFSECATISLCPERLYNHISLCRAAPRNSTFEFRSAVQGYGKEGRLCFLDSYSHDY